MSKAERVSSVDITWLRMDSPANPMVINGLLILKGPLDLDKLEATLAARFAAIPRFKQHVETRGGEYWWVDDPYFDEARHIKRVRLPGKGDQAELQRYVAQLASDQLDKSRPLWQLHIVEDYRGGAAAVVRIHHVIGDGMALVGIMLCIIDGGDMQVWNTSASVEPPPWLTLPGFRTVRAGLKTLQKGIGLTADLWKEAASLAANPLKTAKLGAGVAQELAYLLTMPDDSWTRFKGKPSGNKRVAWTDPIPLGEVKAVSKALGCTVNDMLLASVAGALRQYLKDKDDPVRGVEIRALVPVDMRSRNEAGSLGNKFGIVGVELPVGIENPLMRLQEVHRRMQALRQSLEPPVTLGMLAALGYAPQMLQDRVFNLLLRRATAVMTNVPGPQFPLYIGGAEIEEIMFWVPQPCDIGMGVSILSFNGRVQFGLITDAQMVPDPEAIIAHFRPQFEELLYYVLMSPWGEPDAEAPQRGSTQMVAEAAAPFAPASRPASKPRTNGAQAEKPVSPTPEIWAQPRKSRRASKPAVRDARAKSADLAEPQIEAAPAEAPRSRPASKPRRKSAKPSSSPQAVSAAALELQKEASDGQPPLSQPSFLAGTVKPPAVLDPGLVATARVGGKATRSSKRRLKGQARLSAQAALNAAPEPKIKAREAVQKDAGATELNITAPAVPAAAEPKSRTRRRLPRR